MRKFKQAFYGVYLIFFIFIVLLGFTYEDLVLRWDWDWIDTWVGLLMFVLKLGGVGTVLFLILIIIENIHLYSKDQKIKALEVEITSLKAQMFDLKNKEEIILQEPKTEASDSPEQPQ